jgi:hypothetical protein
MAMSFK